MQRFASGVTEGAVALAYGGVALIFMFLLLLAWREPARRVSLSAVLFWAVLLRLLALLAGPLLEDDFYRYLWDGRMFVTYGSPYGIPPAEAFGQELSSAFEAVLDGINFPDIATVYGPALQWLFALGYLIAPAEVWPLQLAFLLLDVAVLCMLVRLAPSGPWWLWAFAPLLVKEFAGTAHPDLLGAACIVAALLARRHGAVLLMGALLGVAAGVKPFAWILLPFLLGRSPRAWGACAATMVVLTLPFLGHSTWLDVWLPEGLRAMGSGWYFNAPLHALLAWLSVPPPLTRAVLGVGFACAWSLCWWQSLRAADSSGNAEQAQRAEVFLFWLLAAAWLVLPVLNPWYLVWWLPFAVLRFRLLPWVASLAVLLSYLTPINTGVFPADSAGLSAPDALYAVPMWVLVLELLAVAVALFLDLTRRQSAGRV